jgi:F-type H+-transporting ATPase subunit alpha
VAIVYAAINGYLDTVAVADVREYETTLFELLENKYADLLTRLEQGQFEESDVTELKTALAELQR